MNAPRVLVVRICCIGDVVFTTPLARAVRRAWPRSEIVYLAGPHAAETARRVPFADRVIEFPERASAARRASFLHGLRRERFDIGFCLHRRLAASLGIALAGVGVRVGFDEPRSRFGLTHRVPFAASDHEVRRNLALLGPLGIPSAGEDVELRLLDGDSAAAVRRLRDAGLDPRAPYAVVLPGGGVNPGMALLAKRWTSAGFRDLVRFLREEAGFGVAVVGAPGDAEAVRAVARDAGPGVAAVADDIPFGTLAGVVAGASYVAGGDTGPVHVAAALGTPTLTLFGPTSPALVAPQGSRHAHVWRPPPCSPCFTPTERISRRLRECRTWECLQALPADDVVRAARAHLARLRAVRAGGVATP